MPGVIGFVARGGLDFKLKLGSNQFQGSVPEVVWGASTLASLEVERNALAGSLPSAFGMLSRLASLMAQASHLTGKIPHSLHRLSSLQHCLVDINKLKGALPESIGLLASIMRLDVSSNRVDGHIPIGVGYLQSLKTFRAGYTQLSGPLPEDWSYIELWLYSNEWIRGTLPGGVMLRTAMYIIVSDNHLSGTIPESLYSCSGLRALAVESNRFRGSLPDQVAFLRELSILAISSNDLSGALPPAIGSLMSISGLLFADTLLEGSIPVGLSQLPLLQALDLNRADQTPAFDGRMPARLARARGLSMVSAQGHRLEGMIPKFTSTLRLLAMQKNRFRRVSDMQFNREGSMAFIFDNRLSCHLPSWGNWTVSQSVVALGNHLAAPKGHFPSWVMSYEKDKLFWVASSQGRDILMRASAGVGALIASITIQVGLLRCLQLILRWQCCRDWRCRVLVDVTSSLLGLMGLQMVCSCLERLLFLEHGFYECPGFLAFMSSGFFQGLGVHTIIVLIWSRFVSYASQPVWLHRGSALSRAGQRGQIWWCSLWVAWLCAMVLVSGLAVVNVMTKCIPGFLQGEGYSAKWGAVLDGCIGVCQGVASSTLIPALARKITQVGTSKCALISVASLVVTCLSPAASVLYLDSACLGRWVYWWQPCHRIGTFKHTLGCRVGGDSVCILTYRSNSIYPSELVVLKHADICSPGGLWFSTSKCVRAMILKLQALLLAKLISSGLPFVSARLISKTLYKSTSDVFLKLALLLEMGLFVGAPLPLVVPFLAMGIFGEQIVAAVAWHSSCLKADILQGTVRTSLAITGLCSFILHVAIVHESSAAVTLLLLLTVQRMMTVAPSIFDGRSLVEGQESETDHHADPGDSSLRLFAHKPGWLWRRMPRRLGA